MQKCKYIRATLCFLLIALFGQSVFADFPDPLPMSGLNLEDFQSKDKQKQDWSSNPFVKHGDNPQAAQMNLYGVILGKKDSMALINHNIVSVGDKIGLNEVVAIQRQKVILRNNDGLYEITMKGASNDKS